MVQSLLEMEKRSKFLGLKKIAPYARLRHRDFHLTDSKNLVARFSATQQKELQRTIYLHINVSGKQHLHYRSYKDRDISDECRTQCLF